MSALAKGKRAPEIDLLGPQGREYEQLPSRASNSDVQAPVSAFPVQ